MEHLYYEKLNEHVYKKTLANGLKVFLIPKPNFHKTFVTFATNYGSNDLSFIPLGKKNKITQPAGIAHFLEHKLFKNPDGTDAFEQLSKYGVNANAFTTTDKTAYLFSGTDNIYGALEYLLDFVQTPYFTSENVKKEQAIIEEEINMYLDDPTTKIYNGLLSNTYKNHPIRIEVIGSIASIYQITPAALYTAYNTFYHPSNMYLIACGNFDVEKMQKIITENQAKKSFKQLKEIKRFYPYEPAKVFKKTGTEEASITMPLAGVSIKFKPEENLKDQYKKALVVGLLLDYYFANSGIVYEKLLEEDLINSTFSTNVSVVSNALSIQILSYTNFPVEFIEVVSATLVNLKRRKISNERFEMLKRSSYGGFIKSINRVEGITYNYLDLIPFNLDLFTIPNLIKEITISDLINVIEEIKSDIITNYSLYPKKV